MTEKVATKTRVRFAPSPTGPLSLGNARTALFNWLFAKHEGGEFLVRMEDTDRERSKKEFEKNILEGLKWLGLTIDGEITFQSTRRPIYRVHLTNLLSTQKAYYCFCTEAELEEERQAQLSQGLAPKYSGRCRAYSDAKAQELFKKKPSVIRLKMPERIVSFTDIVRGKVEFNTAFIGDIIIAKSLEEPLFNFANAVDDCLMGITHVIRGEDHLSNTPKQIVIQEALGFTPPLYAHLPLILGPDRKKLSKRFLMTSVNDYRLDGYLPEAILNFLVLLGWHPEKDREVLRIDEMIKEFDLKRVQKGGALFDPAKLEWLNSYYMKVMDSEELIGHAKPFLPAEWRRRKSFLRKVISLEKERAKKLTDFVPLATFFFTLPSYSASLIPWKGTSVNATREYLNGVEALLRIIPESSFSRSAFEKALMRFAESHGRGEVLWPLRVALSGQEASPNPIDLLEVLGKEESLRRIRIALEKLQ